MSENQDNEIVQRNLRTYLDIARALNLLPARKDLTVEDLANEAKVSWITAKKALHFFHSLRPILPTIAMTEEGGFKIVEKPSPWTAIGALTPEMRILAKLAMLGASQPKQARYLIDTLSREEINSLPSLVAEGMLVGLEDGKYFLSSRGIAIGATALRQIMEMGIEVPPSSEMRETVTTAAKMDERLLQGVQKARNYSNALLKATSAQEKLIDVVMTGKPKSLRDKMQVVLSTFADLERELGMVEDSTLYQALSRKLEITDDEARSLVTQLVKEDILQSPKPGFVKLVHA